MAEQQNYSNHGKFFPPFHFFAAPILLANLIWSFFRLKPAGYSAYSIFSVFVAAALVVTLTVARVMALKVQDRVIRLGGAATLSAAAPRRSSAAHRRFHHRSICVVALCQ